MNRAAARLPSVRLGGFYFLWFAGLGALLPYWGLYMKDQGYSAGQIGSIFALLMATKIVAPNIWGLLADRRGARMPIIRLATGAAALMFLGIPFGDSYVALACLMVAYGFFSNASLPQFEVVTFNHLASEEHRYGPIRLWGSVGFILSVLALGPWVQAWGTAIVPWWVVATLAALFLLSLSVREAMPAPDTAQQGGPMAATLLRPAVLALMVVCLLSQFSHGAYYSFFSIYMEDAGFGRDLIAVLWALGVAAEVLVFAFLPRLITRFGLRQLMLAALLLTTVRWVLLALYPAELTWVVFAQILHLASFGIYHAVAVNMIHRLFRGRLQGRGQALYSSFSFGAGGALGSLCSGLIWEWSPGPAAFWVAAMAAGLAFTIAWVGLREPPPAEQARR